MENLVKKNEQERVGESIVKLKKKQKTIKRKFNEEEEGGGGREGAGVGEPEGKRKTPNLQNVSQITTKGIKGEDGKINNILF